MSMKTLSLPEPMAIKLLEVAPTSVYLRWSILSNHGLSGQELKNLTFEFKTTNGKLHAECVDNEPITEYKARLCGLCDGTKYRFQVRSKLQRDGGDKVIFSKWSSRIEVQTREKMEHFMVISNHGELEKESLKHRLTMYMQENKKLQLQIELLKAQLNESSSNQPEHWQWDSRKIVNWIVRLQNGMFRPYEKKLRQNLKEEGITGQDLHLVDENNLKDWGIKAFKARKVLIQHIEDLTEDDPQPEAQFEPHSTENLADPLPETVEEEDDDTKQENIEQLADAVIEKEDEEEENDKNEEEEEEDAGAVDKKEEDVDVDKEEEDDAAISRSDPFSFISPSVDDILASHSSEEVKKWRYKDGLLSVHVIRATNCDNHDTDDGADSASDPYVELELKGNYKKERTQTVFNDANPVWKDAKFQLFVEDAKNDTLYVTLWDHDRWTPDDKIGEVQIPVIIVLGANGRLKKEFDVKGSKSGCKLELELKYRESQFH